MTQPLPAPYSTWERHDFSKVANYIADPSIQSQLINPYHLCPIIPTYHNLQHRQTMITRSHPGDVAAAQQGVSLSSAVRHFPSQQGGIGIVCSPMHSAVAPATNDWHMVGFLRQGDTAWVYDSAYVMGSQTRLPMIPGVGNVVRMLALPQMKGVTQIQV